MSLGMRVRVVRTVGRTSACANAGPIEPGFNIAAFPNSAPSMFGIALGGLVFAPRILRPIQRKSIADKPLAEIGTAGPTCRDGPSIPVQVDGHAVDRTPRDIGIKIVRRLCATPVL